MSDLAVLGAKFELQGLARFERGVDRYIQKLGQANRAASQLGSGGTFGKSGQQAGAAFARSFESSTGKLGVGGVNTARLGSLGRDAGRDFARSFAAATRTLAIGATAVAGVAALGVGAAGAVIADSTKLAASFEKQIVNTALITGATGDQLVENQARLGQISKDLGASTAFTAREVAKGLEFTSLAGFSVDESIEAIPGILAGAAATGQDLGDVSDIVTDNLSALGLAAKDSNRLVDVLVATTQKSNTDFLQLGQALSFAAVDGTALGESAETISAALGVLADNGIKATRGGTGLRRIFARLKNPTGAASDALKELGINVFDAEGQFRGLTSLLEDFNRVSQDLTQEQRAAQFGEIFGIQGEGIATILLQNVSRVKELNAELLAAEGTAERVAAGQLDTLDGQVTILQSALEGARLAFGEPLLEPLKQGAAGLATTVQGLIPLLGQLGESLATNFVAPRVERFTAFVKEIGPQIKAAIAGEAFSIELGDFLNISRDAEAFKFDLAGLLTLTNDGEKETYSLFDFVEITRTSELYTFALGDIFKFTNDGEKKTYNFLDFITIEKTADQDKRRIGLGDLFVEQLSTAEKTTYKITDFITIESPNDSDRKTVTIGDFYTGVFDENGDSKEVIEFGDLFTVKTAVAGDQRLVEVGDVYSLAWDTDGNFKEVIKFSDVFEIENVKDGDKRTIAAGDLFSFESNESGSGNRKRELKFGDFFEISFDGFFTERVQLGDYVTFDDFEIDIGETARFIGKVALTALVEVTPLDELITAASFVWPDIPAPQWLDDLTSLFGLLDSRAERTADERTDRSRAGVFGFGAVNDTARATAAAADQVLLQQQFNNNPIKIPVEVEAVTPTQIEGAIASVRTFGGGGGGGVAGFPAVKVPIEIEPPKLTVGEILAERGEALTVPAEIELGPIGQPDPVPLVFVNQIEQPEAQTAPFILENVITPPNAQVAGLIYELLGQAEPANRLAFVSYLLGDQGEPLSKSALVDYIKGTQQAPEDRTAFVNYVSTGAVPGDVSQFNGPAIQLFTGTPSHSGGPAFLGERGRELVRFPSGALQLVNQPSYAPNLPAGTRVWSNPDTERMINRAYSSRGGNASSGAVIDYDRLARSIADGYGEIDNPDISVNVRNSHDVEQLAARISRMRRRRL